MCQKILAAAFAIVVWAVSPCMGTRAFAQSDTCAEGYVWREAFPDDHVCVTKDTHDLVVDENRNADANRNKGGKGDQCELGFVWRMAGPQDHVCVTQPERDQAQQDNSVASSRTAAAAEKARPLQRSEMRRTLQTLPKRAGCFKHENGEWQETPCLSEEYIRRNFPPPTPQYSIKANPIFRLLSGRQAFLYTMPIRVGSVTLSHLSDPSVATLTDTLFGKDAFSIQVNTNFFPAKNRNTGWVQFVLQSKPGSDDALCVWLVDVTVALATANASGYTPVCTSVPKQRYVWGPGDTFPGGAHQTTFVGIGAETGETSEVAGLVDDTQADGTTRLTAWAFVPWAPFTSYAITTNDTVGLRGRWTEVSGDIIGLGNGSQAKFTRTKLRNVLEASSCIYGQCPDSSRLGTFQNYASSSVQSVTAESNNLNSYYDFGAHDPVLSCAQETCTLDYSAGPRLFKLIGVKKTP